MKLMTKTKMKAIAIEHFGGIETLAVQDVLIPDVGPEDILINVKSAGVGVWDPFEREGGFSKVFGFEPEFPYILGTDGAGEVVGTGNLVKKFKEGDRVYGFSLMNPKGGFYAEYTAINAENAAFIPENLSTEQAGVMPVDAITALQGLEILAIKPEESLMIFGASGGIGHLAVQLAKRMGARVLAIASGDDGIELMNKIGADAAIDGRKDDIKKAAHDFAPNGIDTALLTSGGDEADKALNILHDGGRVAYPNGVELEPKDRPNLRIDSFDGLPSQQLFEKLNRLIESGPFIVHISRKFPLEKAAEAHRAILEHHIGKFALIP